MQKSDPGAVQDYGTSCADCEHYQKLGDICMIEHGKKFQWEYCRDFVPQVVLPDYKELMRSVRTDQALERRKEKDKREKEKRKKQKEREEKKELKKKKRRAMLRRRRERLKEKLVRAQLREERKSKRQSPAQVPSQSINSTEGKPKKKSGTSNLEDAQNSIVRKRNRVAGKRSNVPDDKGQS